MSKSGKVLKTHIIHDNSHNKAGRQQQFTPEGDPYRHPYCVKISAKIQPLLPKLSTILYTATSFKTIHFLSTFLSKPLHLVNFSSTMASGQLIFQPPMFDWPSDDQQTAFNKWQGHITLVLEASNIPPERWYASIIGFLGTKGFK